jgi:iron complex transport system substrate-binding protein
MAAGNWVPELADLAGGTALFAEPGKHSSWLTWEDLSAQDPEVIVVMPCGFDLKRTAEEMPRLTQHPAWSGLRAVRDGRVALVDGGHFFNRPGPRLVESLEILVEILNPRLGSFGHAGRAWRPA